MCIAQSFLSCFTLSPSVFSRLEMKEKGWRSGAGVRFQWQAKKANYLTITAADNCFNVYDRYGEKIESTNLPGTCTSFAWNADGELLALITDSAFTLFIWDAASKKVSRLDTGFREQLSLICWACSGQLMAVTSSKGNVLIYDPSVHRKLPLISKHNRRISAGAWSRQFLLCLLSEDGTITVSNRDGETMLQTGVRGEGALVQFNFLRLESESGPSIGPTSGSENCVSLILQRKLLFLINIHDSEVPVSITFPPENGSIVDYVWLRDGLILVGFSGGTFSLISSHAHDFGKEVASFRGHKDSLACFAYSPGSKKLASCSANTIRIFDLGTDLQGILAEEVLTVDDETRLEAVQWTEDGQILSVSSSRASVYAFLSKLPLIGGSCEKRVAFLSSLTEVSVHTLDPENRDDGDESVLTVRLETEPSGVAVGSDHVVAVMNNKTWFYSLTGPNRGFLLKTIEYVGIIKDLRLNSDYAAVLFTDGRIKVHMIDGQRTHGDSERETGNPESREPQREALMIEHKGRLSAMQMTGELLVYASDQGAMEFFHFEDWAVVSLYRHSLGIKFIECDLMGLRVAAIDDFNKIFIYNAVTEVVIDVQVDSFSSSPTSILWDKSSINSGLFIACGGKNVYVHSFVKETVDGAKIEFVDACRVPGSQSPLLLYDGNVICQTTSGNKADFTLSTHEQIRPTNDTQAMRERILPLVLKLRRFHDAILICRKLNDSSSWDLVTRAALYDMDISTAITVCAKIPDFGLHRTLRRLVTEADELQLLKAHVAVCLGMYDAAQQLFLSSSRPEEALTMRQNLQDWETALTLAKRLSPHLIPLISREYASQLELSSEYESALIHFEKAVINSPAKSTDEAERGVSGDAESDSRSEETTTGELAANADQSAESLKRHEDLCLAGIARNAIRTGNTQRGLKCALKLRCNRDLQLECAHICEAMNLLSEAAGLYEAAQEYEHAVHLYIKVKNVTKVTQLIDHISSPESLVEFARMQERNRRFSEAVAAYEKAGEREEMVRILLHEMKNPSEAMRVVRQTRSVEGAKMIAKFFQKINDMSSAIEFLVLSQCTDEAFRLAASTGQMDIYANVLLSVSRDEVDSPPISDFHSVAIHYEQERNALQAGKFYCLSHEYRKGVKLLLSAISQSPGSESEAFQLAIDAAAKSQDDSVIRRLVDFLVGDVDGTPRDFKYLFRLYMKLGHYKEAAKTAVAIACDEQLNGNYRNAHSLLLGMSRELTKHHIRIPSEMIASLLLVHSYLLAKAWIKIGDHVTGARLLLRVVKNISRFPAHTVPILTSAVIECTRASLKKQAIEYASLLMKPEHRDLIDPKLKKKIENLVRKSAGVRGRSSPEAIEVTVSACPFCQTDVPDQDLSCSACKNEIPFCIATGNHLSLTDVCLCPNCDFPALMQPLSRLLQAEPLCPMCSSEWPSASFSPMSSESLDQYLSRCKQE